MPRLIANQAIDRLSGPEELALGPLRIVRAAQCARLCRRLAEVANQRSVGSSKPVNRQQKLAERCVQRPCAELKTMEGKMGPAKGPAIFRVLAEQVGKNDAG